MNEYNVGDIYFDSSKQMYWLITGKDSEYCYGRSSIIQKPSFLESALKLDQPSKECYDFGDNIIIYHDNIVNHAYDQDGILSLFRRSYIDLDFVRHISDQELTKFKELDQLYYKDLPSDS